MADTGEFDVHRELKRRRCAPTNTGTGTTYTSPREYGIMRKDDTSISFLGSSSGIHFVRTVYNAFARRFTDLQQARDSGHETVVPGEDDHIHRARGQGKAHTSLWKKQELDTTNRSLSFEELVRLTHHYFEDWHPIYPFVNAPRILRVMEQISQKGLKSIDRLDAIIVRSIISISAIMSRMGLTYNPTSTPTISVELVYQTVREAMSTLWELQTESPSIPLLQAAFSIQLFLTSILCLNTASRVGGFVTRMAFHLGLHRCPTRYSCFTSEDVTMRRRIFWSIYCLERYLNQALGVPLSIRDDDFDVCYPQAERHSAGPEDMGVNAEDSRLRLLTHLAKFARLRGLISELRNKSIMHSQENLADAAEVDSALLKWWNEVYDDVYTLESDSESPLQPYQALLLIVSRHEATISLYRPLLAAHNPTAADYKTAFQLCINSARSLLVALYDYINTAQQRAPLTSPSFTSAVWMSCMILIYAAWTGHFTNKGALRYARVGISVLRNIAIRESDWPETCIHAIEDLCSAMENSSQNGTPSVRQEGQQLNPTISSQHNDTHSFRTSTSSIDQHSRLRNPRLSDHNQERFSVANNQQFTPYQVQSPPITLDHQSRISIDEHRHLQEYLANPTYDSTGILAKESDIYNPASVVFGDSSGNGLSYGMVPQYAPTFPTLNGFSMNEGWTVADGPWLIHGDFDVL
ncbi:C6 transcription factor, putative [Talaromyces stipitatus ATCC 10500]|uniref:C6 transcription factor, putative n=1 Tax=Talaromyces stipitatus (strain ATCC 10500 / CBS 375.48 / QM 6759 / NRRL 1006) TaxID=441959 RepID=B8MG83_TALSN|nr:C6 transcription factor, putative [Talaromyces stipitatus ATCC 10500]EED15950.1 C6 transcription factor, putative [Talaromyces stipitatus ATCC 10500]